MKLDSADDRPTGIDIKSAPLEADTMGMDFSTDEKKLPYRKPELIPLGKIEDALQCGNGEGFDMGGAITCTAS